VVNPASFNRSGPVTALRRADADEAAQRASDPDRPEPVQHGHGQREHRSGQ